MLERPSEAIDIAHPKTNQEIRKQMIHQNIELTEFQSLGNFSKNIDKDLLSRALVNCEISILQRWMGLKAVAEFDDYSDDIKQIIYKALALLASGWVMKNNVYVSRGGAVEKKDAEVSRNLTSAELNTQVSQLRLEARELMSQAEQLVIKENLTTYEWRREVNVLNLWSFAFVGGEDMPFVADELGIFDSTFDNSFN
jgi:vacuolar-type H+-ATPase subunit C/Vma6